MILNKVDPLIIFKIVMTDTTSNAYQEAAGIPVIGGLLSGLISAAGGIPIPIYLDEQLSGIVVDSIANAYDIDTAVEGINKATALDVSQRVIDSTLTVNMTCNSKDSLILSAILAFMDMILRKAVSRAYTISFINGSTVLLDGLLKSFNTTMDSDSEKVSISMVISKNNGKPDPVYNTINPVNGALPISGQVGA